MQRYINQSAIKQNSLLISAKLAIEITLLTHLLLLVNALLRNSGFHECPAPVEAGLDRTKDITIAIIVQQCQKQCPDAVRNANKPAKDKS